MDRARKAEPHASETMWHREVHKNLEGHLSRMNHMTPFIDNAVPKTAAMGGSSTSKKSQLKEDRLDAIEVENRRLLERIATIALTTGKGADDEKAPKKSLHDGQRKREQERIYMENQAMLRRLQTVKPTLKQKDPKKGNKWKLKFVKSKEHKLSKSEREIETKVDGNAIHVKKASSRKGTRRNKVVPGGASQGDEIVPEPEPSQKTPLCTLEQPDASDAVQLLPESSSSATIGDDAMAGTTHNHDDQEDGRISSPSDRHATEELQALPTAPSVTVESAGVTELVEVYATPAQSDATADSDASSELPHNAILPVAAMDEEVPSALTVPAPEQLGSTGTLEYEPAGAVQKATDSSSTNSDEGVANEVKETDGTTMSSAPVSDTAVDARAPAVTALASVVAETALLTAVDHMLHGEAVQVASSAVELHNADVPDGADGYDDNNMQQLSSVDTPPPTVTAEFDDAEPAALKAVAQTLATVILTTGLQHVVIERTSPTKPTNSPDEKPVQFEQDASDANAEAVSSTTLGKAYDEAHDATDGAGEILGSHPGPDIVPVGNVCKEYQTPSMGHQDDLYDDGDGSTGGTTGAQIATAVDDESNYSDEEPSAPASAEVADPPADDEADVYDDDLDNSHVHTNNTEKDASTQKTNECIPTEPILPKPLDVTSYIPPEDTSTREDNTTPIPVHDVGHAYSDDEDSSEPAATTAAQQLNERGQGGDDEGGDDYEDDTVHETPPMIPEDTHDDVYNAEFEDEEHHEEHEHMELAYADDGFDDGHNADEDGADYGDENFVE